MLDDSGTGTVFSDNIDTDQQVYSSATPASEGDYAPVSGSPGVDSGYDIGGWLPDYAGNIRGNDGDGDGTGGIDAGAYEFY